MKRSPKSTNNKVRIEKNKKYFNSPLDENNNPYWVPIVTKDKSYLLGFINAYRFVADLHGMPPSDLIIALSSDRFNDIMIDGSRIHKSTKKQLKEKFKKWYYDEDRESDHSENDENILDEYFLSISCPNCNMFYAFKNDKEIPDVDFKCATCGQTLISYTYESDDYFDFDGDASMVEEIVDEINKENE